MSVEGAAATQMLDELFGQQLAGPRQLHSLDDGPGSAEAGDALLEVLDGFRRYRPGDPSIVFSLDGIAEAPARRLLDVLGEGEVTLTVVGNREYRVRETALHGLWRVQVRDGDEVIAELLEIADVPAVVRAANQTGTHAELSIGDPPKEAMNVLPVLAELRHRSQTWRPGVANHVVSFTLLPMNDADMKHLAQQLGHGPVRGESKGYGRCSVELTGHRNVWCVQHFNSVGALVLDTLEVGDVPVALTAGAEDFEDSATRLAELLGA